MMLSCDGNSMGCELFRGLNWTSLFEYFFLRVKKSNARFFEFLERCYFVNVSRPANLVHSLKFDT